MIRWLLRIVLSRVIGFVLVAMLAFSVVSLARNWLVLSGPAPDANMVAVPHPNLEKAEVIVRQHIQEVRQRCETIVASRSSTRPQRGRGFGELGKVYLSYDFPESAAACFRNAATLEPDQFRWHYYLAHALTNAGKTPRRRLPWPSP